MYNPQYTTRFGVILEAYLKGCGESMLKQFEDQVEMQTTLERIGLEVSMHGVCIHVCMVCIAVVLMVSDRALANLSGVSME